MKQIIITIGLNNLSNNISNGDIRQVTSEIVDKVIGNSKTGKKFIHNFHIEVKE